MSKKNRRAKANRLFAATFVLFLVSNNCPATEQTADFDIALSLADMLRAARTVVAGNQDLINDPDLGDKKLSGEFVVNQALKILPEQQSGLTNNADDSDRKSRYLRLQSEAIAEVMDENQSLINQIGTGFKGFVPAVFARLVNERFSEKADREAQIKVTAPPDLIRNRKARPDEWELGVIEKRFRDEAWSRGTLFAESAESNGRAAFRVMVPEYYGQACLSCHGNPKDEVDITGYPKEGVELDQLAGAISITLFE